MWCLKRRPEISLPSECTFAVLEKDGGGFLGMNFFSRGSFIPIIKFSVLTYGTTEDVINTL